MYIPTPQDYNWWKLDLFLCRLGILCSACGFWKWDRPCFSDKHWFEKSHRKF